MNDRISWVDRAKGIGIILVVLAHNLGGQRNAGLPLPPHAGLLIQYAYSFHMPLFFFLSGLFAEQSFRKGPKKFFLGKLATVFYPFVIWSVIQGVVQGVLGRFVNHPLNIKHDLSLMFVKPIGQMWFLYALFLIFVLFGVLRLLNIPVIVSFILAVVFLFLSNHVHSEFLGQVLYNYIFFVLGVWLSSNVFTILSRLSMKSLLLLIAGLTTAHLFLVFGINLKVVNPPVQFVIACVGIADIVLICTVFMRQGSQKWLTVVGEYSLVIFLMHTIVGSGFRIISVHILHLRNPWFHSVGELLAGVTIPMAIAYLCTTRKWMWPFQWQIRPRAEKPELVLESAQK